MRWFTREWADGHLSSDDAAERELAYLTHLDSLDHPSHVALSTVAMRDSTVQAWAYDDGLLLMSVLTNAGAEFEIVDLRFEGVTLSSSSRHLTELMLTAAGHSIAAVELDQDAAGPSLRALIVPEGEVSFGYENLVMRRAPASPAGTVRAIDD